jgi:hypothetical protein
MRTRFVLRLMAFCVVLAPAAVSSQSQESQSQESQSQYTPAEKGACMADALAVCAQFIPDRERVGTCLVANASQISPACREAIKHFVPQTATR